MNQRRANGLTAATKIAVLAVLGLPLILAAPVRPSAALPSPSVVDDAEHSGSLAPCDASGTDSRLSGGNNITYGFENGTGDIAGDGERQAIRDAFAIWASATPLIFAEQANASEARIVFSWQTGIHGPHLFAPFDGQFDGAANGALLAHTDFSLGIVHFDDAENWTLAERPPIDSQNVQPLDLQTVALHEIGHALGLYPESNTLSSVMYCGVLLAGSHRYLGPEDIDRIQLLYGSNAQTTITVSARVTDPVNHQPIPTHVRTQRVMKVFVLRGAERIASGEVAGVLRGSSYVGRLNLIMNVPWGDFTVQLELDHTLRAQAPGTYRLYRGAANTLPIPVEDYPGDIVDDDRINITDYVKLLDCYSDLQPARSCDPTSKIAADVDDDGSVNGADYNLWLRVKSTRPPASGFTGAKGLSATEGALDPTFGTGGMLTTIFPAPAQANDLVIQPDGKLVAAGFVDTGGGFGRPQNFALARYLPSGALDSSFDGDGKATVDFGFSSSAAGLALQPDGKLLVAGTVTVGSTYSFAVARMHPDGTPDSGFDGDGRIAISFGSSAEALSVAVQPDGKLVVVGRTTVGGVTAVAITRHLANGALDTTFDGDGKLITDFGEGTSVAASVAVQPDGGIVVAGTAVFLGDGMFAAARYLGDGTLDSSFGDAGILNTDIFPASGGFDSGQDLVLQPDGKIVIAGQGQDDLGNSYFAAARYLPSGTPDPGFGTDGIATVDAGIHESAYAVALQPDGGIVMAGGDALNSGNDEFSLARLLPDGTVDLNFGDGGRIGTDFGRPLDVALAVVAQPDGRVIAAGASANPGSDFALARYVTGTVVGVPGGRFTPLTPARILDTRNGTGGITGPLASNSTVDVQITGRGGVPAAGVSAVTLNVTVTQPSGSGFLTLYPTGSARPLDANLNFVPDKTVPNLVVVKLGAGGKVSMYNSAGTTHVIYDVAGWYSDSGTGDAGRYTAVAPARILDTRNGTGGGARLGPGASLDVQVSGQGGLPAAGAAAAVLNVAATGPTSVSFLTVYPTGESRPLAANLNFKVGDTVSNRAMVKLGAGGKVTIYNNAGSTDVVVDVGGWFSDASVTGTSGAYTPLTPARILDTRFGTGGITGPIVANTSVDVQVTGQGGVPATGVSAVILNATVVSPAAAGFLTVFPAGSVRPVVSDLNYASGEVRPNLVVVRLGAGGKVTLFTSKGTHVVFDVAGWVS